MGTGMEYRGGSCLCPWCCPALSIPWDIPATGSTPRPSGALLLPLRTQEKLQDQELPPFTPHSHSPFAPGTQP